MKPETYHQKLRRTMDEYAHLVYKITSKFPKAETYGLISQLQRAALSVVLNYIEGYARLTDKIHKNFLKISYGSLKESRYLLTFCFQEKYMSEEDHELATKLADEIGAMLWRTFNN